MPERIYLFDCNDAMTTPLEGDTEYIRKDSFIEKACEWLERNGSYYIGFEQGLPCVTEELIKSLKKYLEKQA